jgi:hypothetical protein
MPGFGRQTLGNTGNPLFVLASDPSEADWKLAGVTVDWPGTVTAVSGAAVTLIDGNVIPIGAKYLRYGQVLCRITNRPSQTLTETGIPTGGTFTVTGTRPDNGFTATTTAIAQAATAAAVQTALEAIYGVGNVTVTGSAGGPWTVAFPTFEVTVSTIVLANNSLTGGTTPTVVIAVVVGGASYGKYGPYDSAATDGRQTLTPGECFVLNETVTELPLFGFGAPNSDNPAVFDGGKAWKPRLLMTTGTHSLANGPTVTEFIAAFARMQYVS